MGQIAQVYPPGGFISQSKYSYPGPTGRIPGSPAGLRGFRVPATDLFIVVSPIGLAETGIVNNGADFGPDTPGTQTSGIQEAGNYVTSNGGGIVFLEQGLFLIDTNINATNWYAVSMIGSGSNITTSGISNAFGNGTTIAPSNNWNPKFSATNIPIPSVSGSFTYYPLIYIQGLGSNSSTVGTNLEFKNFLLSGVNTLNGSPFSDTMGIYANGVWNLVVDHVDTQNLWWGKYFNFSGSKGNSNWYLNSTDINLFDVGVLWSTAFGAMVNSNVMFVSGGHVQASNSNISGYAYVIEGVNNGGPVQATNLSFWDGALYLANNAVVTNVFGGTDNTTPVVILGGSYSTLSGFYLDALGTGPMFTVGGPVTNCIISNGIAFPSNNSTNKTQFFIGEISLNSIVGNEVLFTDISLVTGSNAYWASPIISATSLSGYVNPVKFKNIQGLSSYYTPTLTANPPVSGTVYQNLTFQDIVIYLPVYATTAGTNGSVAVALGTTSTPTTKYTKFVSGSTSSTATDIVILEVPAGWYYSFTGTGVTFGTATVEAI